ncbi:MAG TPA: DUF4232 domain-containing protein [Jatrophihabitans sp.]|nr:DUF4232 domain-containing protein [Jatrophihabitans sp.]
MTTRGRQSGSRRARVLPPAALALLVGLALSGCTSDSAGSAPTPSIPGIDNTASDLASASDSPTDSPSDPGSAAATDAPSASDSTSIPVGSTVTAPAPNYTVPTAGLAACALPYLHVTARAASGGNAHAGVIIEFTNTGQIPCALGGYPNVAILDARGQQVKQAAHTPSGYLGGQRHGAPRAIGLGSGGSASALLEGEVVDVDGASCPAEPGLSVLPPGTRTAARVAVRTALCGGTQVHPVVPGTTGSSG